MNAALLRFPRRFSVRRSTTEEAAWFKGRRGPGDQAVTVIDHVEDEVILVVAAADAVIEDTDQCARSLFREQVA